MVIFWQDCYGKGNLRKSHRSTVGRRFPLGNAYSYTVKRVILICVCGWHQIGWKETNSMWKVLNKAVDLGETASFFDHVSLGCTQRQCEISKDIVDNYRTMFESRISVGGTEKLPFSENLRISWWSYGGSCKEMCGAILWVSKQDDSTTVRSIYSMHWWPSFQKGRIEICRRIVKSILSNYSEMLILGTYWKTWYSPVSEQTCKIDYEMDQSMWQTIMSFYILHPSHMWIQTVLFCG